MHKRFYAQRQHVISTIDTLCYQLHTVAFFLSPSILLYVCRILSQFQCAKPRELDPNRPLRFYYSLVLLFNAPSLWKHAIHGVEEGRAIILDFIGLSYLPSKFQLFTLDIFIMGLQLLLTTISYETSVYYTSDEANPEDLLLQHPPDPLSIPLSRTPEDSDMPRNTPNTAASQSPHTKLHASATAPLIIDLRFDTIMKHFRQPPPLPRANTTNILPLPNTTHFPFPGMRLLLRTGRQMRRPAGPTDVLDGGRESSIETQIPGAMDNGLHR